MVDIRKARFATEGFRVKRCNPDKTYATAQRTVGFIGEIDISDILTADKAELSVKVGWNPWQIKEVDFSGVDDSSALTPEDAVLALELAQFTGVVFSVDGPTGRLKAVAADAIELQIKGELAAALDFGQGRQFGGLGVYYKSYLNDETMGITMPNDIKDKEQIDQEGAQGAVTRMIIPAKRLGVSPAIVTKFKDDELLNMIQGGIYIPGTKDEPAVYRPPNSQTKGSPLFSLDAFFPLYGQGTSTVDQASGFEQRTYFSCTGLEGEVPAEAKAWAKYSYNITATEANDENGKLLGVEERKEHSLEQFEALHVYDMDE